MPDAYIQECRKLRPNSKEEFHILRSTGEKDFSEILSLALQLTSTIAAGIFVSENGENWVKSTIGITPEQVFLYLPLLSRTMQGKEITTVPEIEASVAPDNEDCAFSFYAGVPLVSDTGENLGVLFVLGEQKDALPQQQQDALQKLAGQVLRLVEFSKQRNQFLRVQLALEQKYQDLEKFASVVSHDIKSPLANIISLTELLKEENKGTLSPETMQYIDFLEESSQSLRSYVDGLLRFYRSEKVLEKSEEDVELEPFFRKITGLYTIDPNIKIDYPTDGILQKVNKAALSQIFLNLLANALKYNHKKNRLIRITYTPTEDYYTFEVEDNGNGIAEKDREKIFDLFTTLEQNDRYGHAGSGIGLATVKKLVTLLGGDIQVRSETGVGSNFIFRIKR